MKISEAMTALVGAAEAATPICLWGPPGIGKTSLAEAVKSERKVDRMITLRANLMEPVDFNGYPWPREGRMTFLKPDFHPDESETGILFIDELPQAPMAVQCAAMRLVDSCPSTWQVIAAGNRSTDRAGAGQVATHVLSRFTHIDIDVSRDDWQSWAARSGVRPEVRAFIDYRPALLHSFEAADAQKNRAFPSPRSWHRVSRLLDCVQKDVLLQLLSGTVGEGPGAEFWGFLQVYEKCPSPDVIIAKPTETMVPREPSALFAVCAALADRARTMKPDKIEPILVYMNRLPIEFGAVLITDLLAIHTSVVNSPIANKWISAHRDVFGNSRS